MNLQLWQNILDFNLDEPLSEYGFTTRLEYENYWTSNFALSAIAEYQKFMYLAAVSDAMVSPSAIVDIVWHQHLLFTKSYANFCAVLGKDVAHIPSTHHSNEALQFKMASERTQKLYIENFGEQPAEIWKYADIYGPLSLKSTGYTVQGVYNAGIPILIAAIAAAYFLLHPLYITIDNPDFLIGYCSLVIVAVTGLYFYNRIRIAKIIDGWDKNAFAFNLSALELVYLRRKQLKDVINGVVNQLILAGKISLSVDQPMMVNEPINAANAVELCVLQTIAAEPDLPYQQLLAKLSAKPVFDKTAVAMDVFSDRFEQSVAFITLFIQNFALLGLVFLLGAVRLATGMVRDRPVLLITYIMIACFALFATRLRRLSIAMGSDALPRYYKKIILPVSPEKDAWDWEYFLLGNAVFVSAFIPMAGYQDSFFTNQNNSGSSCGSGGDSGSSCGSSCGGSSCGGCGGD